MQEAEEQDTCRICSAPAEAEQPLFYPCKCSGTIRYIHQDCLTTWLAHSKKKTCDVCKHPYSFTKVYATDMPTRLPPVLLLRRVAQQSFFAMLFAVRAVVVAIIWLAVLPWATVMTWRTYFSMGDSTAWWISDRPRPPDAPEELSPFYLAFYAEPTGVPPPDTFVARVAAHPFWLSLSSDIFTGQIIASLVVLTFVAVFLLREWISQNARPGVFEDEDPEPIPAPLLPPPPPPPPLLLAPAPPPPNPNVNDRIALAQRQMDAVRAMDAMRTFDPPPRPSRKRRYSHKGKEPEEAGGSLVRSSGVAGSVSRRRVRMDDTEKSDEQDGQNLRHRRRRNLHQSGISVVDEVSLGHTDNFEFTFRSPTRFPQETGAFGRRSLSEPPSIAKFSGVFDRGSGPPRVLTPSPVALAFAPAALDRPAEALPSALPKPDADADEQGGPSDSNPQPSLDSSSQESSWTTASSSFREARLQPAPKDKDKEGRYRRPQLPNTTPTIDDPAVGVVLSPAVPSLSPGLATYRAPEELEPEAGPSRRREYFDRDEVSSGESDYKGKGKADGDGDGNLDTDTDVEMEMEDIGVEDIEAEHARYFADAEDDDEDDMPKLQPPSDSEDEEEEEGSPRIDDDMDGDFDIEEDEGGEDEDGEDGGDFDDAEAPIWQAIQIEDDEVAEVGDGEMDAGAAEHEVAAPAPVPPAGGDGAIDLNDDLDGNVEDDMEGAMEAIGMRGPVYGVVQNAALMIFVLDTAIGLLVWIPFTLGKSTALLSLDPQRFLQILHLPIRAMRIVTDPIVDSVMYIVASVLLPLIARIFYRIANLLFFGVLFFISVVFGQQRADKAVEVTSAAYSRAHKLSDKPLEQLFAWSSLSSPTTPVPTEDSNSTLFAFQATIVDAAEPYFAALGKEVRISSDQIRTTWTHLALGHGAKEKVFAIALGYVVVMILVSLYLNLFTVGNMKTAGRAVRTAVREQLLVLKVATFIFIELVTFPLGCGIVLDVCTVCLFPEASFVSRIAFFKQAPLTAMFYHWVAGTMFMYSFAVLLSGCRTLLRKGAMWFIKDPQAQDSHPIRDILDRPTLTQLRKICVSGVMYSFVVACVVGSVAGLLYLGSKSILPFRWKNREPLSNVPVDLIFLHVVLPYTTHYFRPRTGIKRVSKALWKFLASRLRLSSYFFGGRFPEEEYTSKHWLSLLHLDDDCEDPTNIKDGTFRRVPASDNISLPRDMHATAAVTEEGEPFDDEAQELIRTQNEEAIKAKRTPHEDYIVVYIPPLFRYRVFAFISILWVLGAMFLGVVFALPIQLGRSFFGLFVSQTVHDGYSFLAGAYLLWACYLAGRAVDRLDKRRQRRGGDEPRADLRLLVVKRGLLWSAKIAYMVLFLGIIIPTLVAVVVDLYIVLPIRLSLDPVLVPRIRIVDEWAMGLLYAKIMLHVNRAQPANPITRGVQHITNNGWMHPEPVTATREVIGPVTFGLLGMILLPGGAFLLAQYFIPIIPRNSRLLFMEVYPAIFVAVAGVRFGAVLFEMLGTWSQAIRDKEFLVEMRLRNLEPEAAANSTEEPKAPVVSPQQDQRED